MSTITRSGSKVTVSLENVKANTQLKISSTLKTPITVGNQHVKTSISIPAKKLTLLKKLLGS
jgi:hypothetical protein